MSKAIKISDENHKWLSKLAGSLQAEKGARASIDDAISYLKKEKKSILNLAGSWDMSDKEAEEFKKDLRKGWSSWKINSF